MKPDNSDRLSSLFDALRAEWLARTSNRAVASNEEVAEELRVPIEDSRFLFLSIPRSRVGLYRDEVYSAAERAGFTAVTSYDVSAGESVLATITSLIERADVMIADMTSGSRIVRNEYDLGAHRERKWLARAVVVRPGETWVSTEGVRVFVDDSDSVTELRIAGEIRQWLQGLEQPLVALPDADRLLALRQPTAAVIFAFRALEQALRHALKRPEPGDKARRATLSQLLREAELKGVLDPEEGRTIREWIGLRNLAVHGARDISQATAAATIGALNPISERLFRAS